jgi:hypothetical protein
MQATSNEAEMPANGLELSRSAEAGGATHTLAPAGEQGKPLADSAEQLGRHLDSPHRRARGVDLSARPPSRLRRVVRRRSESSTTDPWLASAHSRISVGKDRPGRDLHDKVVPAELLDMEAYQPGRIRAKRHREVPGVLPLGEGDPVAYFPRPDRGFPPDVLRATAARTSALNAAESILSPS